ncbi:MAG: hypothetical protein ABI600_06295 [Luteolibacter sp.]
MFTLRVTDGTNLGRALIVRRAGGAELGVTITNYLSRNPGIPLHSKDPHLVRQTPADYPQRTSHSTLVNDD